jgi:hypothetical protein
VGQLKELKLEIEDEISCLRLFKDIILNETPKSMTINKTPKVKGNINPFLNKDIPFDKLDTNVRKKKRLKSEIINLTKEIFKLNFKVEENSNNKYKFNLRSHLQQIEHYSL